MYCLCIITHLLEPLCVVLHVHVLAADEVEPVARHGLGFGVWGLGFVVCGLWFGVWVATSNHLLQGISRWPNDSSTCASTSHITHHTSHITHHTSNITHHTSAAPESRHHSLSRLHPLRCVTAPPKTAAHRGRAAETAAAGESHTSCTACHPSPITHHPSPITRHLQPYWTNGRPPRAYDAAYRVRQLSVIGQGPGRHHAREGASSGSGGG